MCCSVFSLCIDDDNEGVLNIYIYVYVYRKKPKKALTKTNSEFNEWREKETKIFCEHKLSFVSQAAKPD